MKPKNFAPNDPDVKIPDAVKAAGASADELHARIYNSEAKPEEQVETQPEQLELFEKPLTTEPPKETNTKQPETTAKPVEDSFEHRYNSMRGRFEQAQKQLTAQAERISSLERMLATMQAQPREHVESDEMRAERLITSEEEQDYGSDFLNVVGKKAKEELLPIIKKYEAEIAGLKAQVNGVGSYMAQDAMTRMTDTLDRDVPGWRDQNVNPEFLQWLALPDPYSGDIRHNMLKVAWERHDGPRVAAFFRGFLAEEAAMSPAMGGQVPAEKAGKVSLESFAAPGRAKTAAATSAPAEKPIITSAQISKFYADCAAGRYNGKDEERARFEKSIFEAQREGRIR